jgi:HlyD family secretion protein
MASISSNGKVEPVAPHVMRARFATFVKRVAAVEGQSVKNGQLILELDADQARAALARAREELLRAEEDLRAARAGGAPAEIAQIESDLRKSEAELTRLRQERGALERLVAKQAATRDELDQNKLALERAEAQSRLLQQKKEDLARRAGLDGERAALAVERARNEARELEDQVRSATVTAPVDGTAYSLPVRAGDFVRVGDLLVEVADLRRVRVRVFVDEPEMGWLEQGQRVEITWDAMPGRLWNGIAEHIPKAVVARGTRSVGEVLCSIENDKLELLPNINVNAQIRVRERANALVVPRAAVRVDGTERYVFLVDGKALRKRPVRVGIAGAAAYEVLEGLAEGDRVALPGAAELKDGLTIRPLEQ